MVLYPVSLGHIIYIPSFPIWRISPRWGAEICMSGLTYMLIYYFARIHVKAKSTERSSDKSCLELVSVFHVISRFPQHVATAYAMELI